MTTNANDALTATTRAMIAATERRLADAQTIKSPAELGIKPRRFLPRRARRTSVPHRSIR